MKIYAIIIFLLMSFGMSAQKKDKYRFDYRFLLPPPKMEMKMEFKQEPVEMSVPSVRGTVSVTKDDESTPIPFATLQFTLLDSNLQHVVNADGNGHFIFTGQPGRYELKVSAVNYLDLTEKFELHIHELLSANIVLTDIRYIISPAHYYVYSIRELTEEELGSIKKCLEEGRRKKAGRPECDKKGLYHILFEI